MADNLERLLFRERATNSRLKAKLDLFRTFVTELADGTVSWVNADYAAQMLIEESECDPDEWERDNAKECSPSQITQPPPSVGWECESCGAYLGSSSWPRQGELPCLCGPNRKVRPAVR